MNSVVSTNSTDLNSCPALLLGLAFVSKHCWEGTLEGVGRHWSSNALIIILQCSAAAEWKSTLVQALLQHAVKGVYTAKELVDVEVVEPVMGIPITIDPPYPPLKISTKAAVAEVLYADIYICKSIVHIIDSVLY